MKTSSLLTALLALVVTAGIATRDDGARADTPAQLPTPNGDATELACGHQNIYLVVCPNGGYEWDCAAGCPECAPSCGDIIDDCDDACTVTCTSTVIGHC